MAVKKNAILATIFIVFTLVATGCDGGPDYFSQLPHECFTPIDPANTDNPLASKPLCRATIESFVPLDNSFDGSEDANQVKEDLYNAFFALAYYPVQLPSDPAEVTLFKGIKPPFQANLFCSWFPTLYDHLCPSFSESAAQTANQHLFNKTVESTQSFIFLPDPNPASYGFHGGAYRYMKLTRNFSNSTFSHIVRAHMLVHESTHGQGVAHDTCGVYNAQDENTRNCDQYWSAAYAAGALYLQAVLNGSREGFLDHYEVREIQLWLCGIALYRVAERSEQMEAFYEQNFGILNNSTTPPSLDFSCNAKISTNWALAH